MKKANINKFTFKSKFNYRMKNSDSFTDYESIFSVT